MTRSFGDAPAEGEAQKTIYVLETRSRTIKRISVRLGMALARKRFDERLRPFVRALAELLVADLTRE